MMCTCFKQLHLSSTALKQNTEELKKQKQKQKIKKLYTNFNFKTENNKMGINSINKKSNKCNVRNEDSMFQCFRKFYNTVNCGK